MLLKTRALGQKTAIINYWFCMTLPLVPFKNKSNFLLATTAIKFFLYKSMTFLYKHQAFYFRCKMFLLKEMK